MSSKEIRMKLKKLPQLSVHTGLVPLLAVKSNAGSTHCTICTTFIFQEHMKGPLPFLLQGLLVPLLREQGERSGEIEKETSGDDLQ